MTINEWQDLQEEYGIYISRVKYKEINIEKGRELIEHMIDILNIYKVDKGEEHEI